MADKNPFSVSPCLFIGIGTNGWRILHELRKLIYEEFGKGGLPCFRFIGIESDSGKRPDDSFLPHRPEPYERVTPVYISIPDVSIVRRRLNPNLRDEYIPGLAEWLDPQLLDRGNKQYLAGAGNSRQAGRMCLWENWSQLTQAVSDSLDSIKNNQNHQEADRFLRRDYFGKKRAGVKPPPDPLVSTSPKVYIFGTLCGGTCSGTFLDIAYYVSRKLGMLADVRRAVRRGVADPEVVGLFTIADLRTAEEGSMKGLVANCWAALRELDFHYHSQGRYCVTFPGDILLDTQNEPFDTVYLESLQNMATIGFDRDDYDGLAHMSAMDLFTEVVAGLAVKKDESRVNLRKNFRGYLESNQAGHVRAFSAFGLAAFWYPKYRIAVAINRQLSLDMCDDWLRGGANPTPIQDQAKKDLANFVALIRGSIGGTIPKAQCNINLEAKINQEFDNAEGQFMEADDGSLGDFLVAFPTRDTTFSALLSGPNGDYYARIANAAPLVKEDLKKKVMERISEFFTDHTCGETREYAAALVEAIKAEIARLPETLNALSQRMEVGLASAVHHGWWASSLGLQKEAVAEYRRILWGDLRRRVLRHFEQLRDYFAKQVLLAAKPEVTNMANQVAQAEGRLRLFRDSCDREMKELVAFNPPGHIVVIAAGEQNSIAEDVELGAKTIRKDLDPKVLRNQFLNLEAAGARSTSGAPATSSEDTFSSVDAITFLTSEPEEAFKSRVDRAFSPYSQNQTASFQIGQKVLETSRKNVPGLIDRAAPYVEAVGAFRQQNVKDAPNFVFCSDVNVAGKLVDQINSELNESRYAPADSPLDHLLIFYHEAVGLALSDLAITDRAAKSLSEVDGDPQRIATSYTHKEGEAMFDSRAIAELYRVTDWLRAMVYLDPDLLQRPDKDAYLEYKSADGLARRLYVNDQPEVRTYLEKYGSTNLMDKLVSRLREIGRPKVEERMNNRSGAEQSRSEQQKLLQIHEEILGTVFANTDGRPQAAREPLPLGK